jgi:hypothetical protein
MYRAVRRYRLTIITNADDKSDGVMERVTEANSDADRSRSIGLSYPSGFYSLSHVALPFPTTDALYGITPDPSENFGENLGALAPRGERNVLIASLDSLMIRQIRSFPTCLTASARVFPPRQRPASCMSK